MIDTAAQSRLQRLNVIAAIAHAAQCALVLVLANDFSLPVTSFYWNNVPGPEAALDTDRFATMFDVRLAWGVAAFLALSAIFHAIVASPWGRPRYFAELGRQQNRFRWVEYSLSATLMILMIALVFGIADISAMIGLAGANVAMILFGWLMETFNSPGTPVRWSPFWFGCIAGIAPWIALLFYLLGPGDQMPSFVYGIFVSIFVFFNLFALNQWFQYRGVGRWKDYLYGERLYLILSLSAKSALAWQIFGNTLAG